MVKERVKVGSVWQSYVEYYRIQIKSIGFGFVVVDMSGIFGPNVKDITVRNIVTTKDAIRKNLVEVVG